MDLHLEPEPRACTSSLTPHPKLTPGELTEEEALALAIRLSQEGQEGSTQVESSRVNASQEEEAEWEWEEAEWEWEEAAAKGGVAAWEEEEEEEERREADRDVAGSASHDAGGSGHACQSSAWHAARELP